MIGGGMGNLAALAGWVSALTPQNGYGMLNPGQSGLAPGMLPEGLELPEWMAPSALPVAGQPGVLSGYPTRDPEMVRQAALTLEAFKKTQDADDEAFAGAVIADLESDKDRFQYLQTREQVVTEDGRTVWVENAEERINQQNREANNLARAKRQNARIAENPPPGSARFRLRQLTEDQDALRELMSRPGGQAEFFDLSTEASIEEEAVSIEAKANELRATHPPHLHGRINALRDQILARKRETRRQMEASEAGRFLADYRREMTAWLASQSENMQAVRESDWTPFTPEMIRMASGADLGPGGMPAPMLTQPGAPIGMPGAPPPQATPLPAAQVPLIQQVPFLNPNQGGGGGLWNLEQA